MANKKFDTARVRTILGRLSAGGNVAPGDRAYLKRYYNSDDQFRAFFDSNFDARILGGGRAGSVRNAQASYDNFGFTPLPRTSQAGPGTQEMILRSGKRTNQTGAWQDAEIYPNGKSQAYGGRLKSKAETESIIKRGLAGASLSGEDQRIFDRWRTMKRESAETDAARMQMEAQQAAIEAQKRQERAEKARTAGLSNYSGLTDEQLDEAVARTKKRHEYEDTLAFEREKAAIGAAEKARAEAEKRRQVEIDNGRTPDMTDADYAKWMQLGGNKYAKWDYSPGDAQDMEDARNRIREAMLRGEMNATDGADAQRQLDEQIASGRWKKRVMPIAKEEWTAEQAFGKTHRLDDGTVLGVNSKGDLYTVWSPKEAKQTPEENTESARKKHILNQIGKDRKEWEKKSAERYLDAAETEENPDYQKPFDVKAAIRNANDDWEAIYGKGNANGEGIEGNTDASFGQCPVCGADINADGVCETCGWKREGGGAYGDTGVAEPVDADIQEPEARTHLKSSYL